MWTSSVGRLRASARRGSRSAAPLICALILGACSELLPTEPTTSNPHFNVLSTTTVTVKFAAQPDTVIRGERVSTSLSIRNNTSKRIVVDVTQTIVGPSGIESATRTWRKHNLPAGRILEVNDSYVLPSTAMGGNYTASILVASNDRSQIYFFDPEWSAFTVESDPADHPVRDAAYRYTRLTDPDRTVVYDQAGAWLATFTDGASTVTVAGTSRVFQEPVHTPHTVKHSTWVRLLSQPFVGIVDEAWLESSLADTSPDILEFAMQYIVGAPPIDNGSGIQIGGEAQYGPLMDDGSRLEGADYNDYLGVTWDCGDGRLRQPRTHFFRSLDCTGYIQMVFGYRGGLPLACSPDGSGIPRNARSTLDAGPGVIVIPNSWQQVTDFSRLEVGDLVFFDANGDGVDMIHHVGIFLGIDSGGNYRFISSVKSANGPTMGDFTSRHLLNDLPTSKGYWAQGFRAARRL